MVNNKYSFNEEEWKEPEKGTRWPKEKRREYLIKIVTELGLYNVNKKELAQKMGITRCMLYKDINALAKQGISKNEAQHAKINMTGSYIKSMKEMQKILMTGTKDEQIKAAKALIDANKNYTDHLERFGLKELVTPTTDTNLVLRWARKKKDGD